MDCCKSLLMLAALMVLPTLALAADARPHCDAKHLGQFWPEPKNDAVANVQQLAQSGELEVCAHTQEWRYGWERLTVTLDQLKPLAKKPVSSSSAHTQQN